MMTVITLPPDLQTFLKRQLTSLSQEAPKFNWNALIEGLLVNVNPGQIKADRLAEQIADSVAFVLATTGNPRAAGAEFEAHISAFADALTEDDEAATVLDVTLREKLGAPELASDHCRRRVAA